MANDLDRVELHYTLTFEAAFRFGSGLPRMLLDRAVRRDAEGYLFVPGSTLKGVLRDRCEQTARLFGLDPPSPHDTGRAQEYERPDLLAHLFGSRRFPGGLYFDDAGLIWEDRDAFRNEYREWQTTERTQVSLSRQTGTARAKLLFSGEFGIKDLRFEGQVTGYIARQPIEPEDSASPRYPLLLLLAGLLSLDRLGGNKSSGAGRTRIDLTAFVMNGNTPDVAEWLEHLEWLEVWQPEVAP